MRGVPLAAVALLAAMPGAAATLPIDEAAALQLSQRAIGRQVADLRLLDADGRPVRLADYRGKPLVVNLVYTSCYGTCPLIVENLAQAVAVAQKALGPDSFGIVTVGFDSRVDTPQRMRSFARARGIDLPNWRFLSGDAATIDRLSDDLGFVFAPSAKGFDHLAQVTVLDRDGRIYHHVYGEDFPLPALVEPLKQLVFGAAAGPDLLTGLVNRVRLLCTVYDPKLDRYRFSYSIFIGLTIGFMSLSGVGFVLARAWWRTRSA